MAELIVVWAALSLGSFGNVFLARFPKGRSLVAPGSSCPHCGHSIRWWHNVPVLGWIILRGRCYDCARPISIRYPAMELAFGVTAGLVVSRLGVNPLSLSYLGFFLTLLLVAWVDWETMYIFDVTTLPLGAAGLLMSWVFPGLFVSPFDSAVAAVEMLAILTALSVLGKLWYKRDVIGGGDLKLMAAGAAFLGTMHAWKALALGVLISLPLLLIYVWAKGLGRKDPAPFGPGLAAGLALVGWNLVGNGSLNGAFERCGLSLLKVN